METELDQDPSNKTNGKKQSLLSEVLVTGLLKNINDKVHNKLDDEAQSELAGIVSSKVKEAGMEAAISFDCVPGSEHLLPSAGKGRVSPPRSQKSRQACHRDSLEEDFESLLRDEDFLIDEEMALNTEGTPEEDKEKSSDSYLDDFEALLAESSDQLTPDYTEEQSCDIEADFDALIEKENVVVESSPTTTKIDKVPEDLKEDTEAELRQQDEVGDKIVEVVEENMNEDHNQFNNSLENPEPNDSVAPAQSDRSESSSVAGDEDEPEAELSKPSYEETGLETDDQMVSCESVSVGGRASHCPVRWTERIQLRQAKLQLSLIQ